MEEQHKNEKTKIMQSIDNKIDLNAKIEIAIPLILPFFTYKFDITTPKLKTPKTWKCASTAEVE